MEYKFGNKDLDAQIIDYKAPDNCDFSYHLTYNDLLRIINRIDESNKPYSCLSNILKSLTNNKYISLIEKKPPNFIRKIKSYPRKTESLDCLYQNYAIHLLYLPLLHLVHTVKKYHLTWGI